MKMRRPPMAQEVLTQFSSRGHRQCVCVRVVMRRPVAVYAQEALGLYRSEQDHHHLPVTRGPDRNFIGSTVGAVPSIKRQTPATLRLRLHEGLLIMYTIGGEKKG